MRRRRVQLSSPLFIAQGRRSRAREPVGFSAAPTCGLAQLGSPLPRVVTLTVPAPVLTGSKRKRTHSGAACLADAGATRGLPVP
jgi:hypothetical protein